MGVSCLFAPQGQTTWWPSSWGREAVSFPSAPALGRRWKGQSCRTDAALAAVVTPSSATGISDDFRVPASCGQCLCYCQNTAPSSFSPVTPRNPTADKRKAMPPTEKGKKNTFNDIYTCIHTHKYSLLLDPQNFK